MDDVSGLFRPSQIMTKIFMLSSIRSTVNTLILISGADTYFFIIVFLLLCLEVCGLAAPPVPCCLSRSFHLTEALHSRCVQMMGLHSRYGNQISSPLPSFSLLCFQILSILLVDSFHKIYMIKTTISLLSKFDYQSSKYFLIKY